MEYWKTPTDWGSLLSTPPMVSGCGEAKQNNYIKWFSEGTQNKRVGANKRHLLAIINLFKSNYSPVSHAPAGHPKPLKVRLRVKFRQLLIGWLHLPCHPPFVSLPSGVADAVSEPLGWPDAYGPAGEGPSEGLPQAETKSRASLQCPWATWGLCSDALGLGWSLSPAQLPGIPTLLTVASR